MPFPTTTASPSSLFAPSFRRRRNLSTLASPTSFLRSKTPNRLLLLRLSASLTDNSHHHFSWFPPPQPDNNDDGFSGWAFVPAPTPSVKKKEGLTAIFIGGTCVAALVAAVGYFWIYRKGFKFQFRIPWHSLEVSTIETEVDTDTIESKDENVAVLESIADAFDGASTSATREKHEHIKASIPVDSTQLEALSTLKKLKIIEDDVRADELCTRREYARWLVRLNSSLERNPKHRIAPSVSLSGSVIIAFDDVDVNDPDFESIQALAEAGIVPSRLSGAKSYGDGSFYFHPEKFISRQDLINWKAQLECGLSPAKTEQMSKTKLDYMDVKEISSDASPELFIDMLAGDKSIIRKVFGWSMRLQPNKPATNAQAAVALTSGRMTEAVHDETLRLEAEKSARQAAMEEIRSELLERGDIERFWDERLDRERKRGFEVDKLYIATLHDLEEERSLQLKAASDFSKEKAAMDCQRQLLHTLKEEVDEMSERLASDRTIYVAEQCNVQKLLSELQSNQEGLLDKQSIIEAEIEALRILRSWIEDEARKSQARAKVLEEVLQRWKWENQG